MLKTKTYKIVDIDCELIVEHVTTLKEIFDWYDDSDGVCYEDDSFEILYKDGSSVFFCAGDELTKVKRRGIASMVYANASSYIVYGNYEIDECGVMYAAFETSVDDNIVLIG